MKAGIPALQGDFLEHVCVVPGCGVTPILARDLDHLAEVDTLVIPGGESTTIGRLARGHGFVEPLRRQDIKELGEQGLLQVRGW